MTDREKSIIRIREIYLGGQNQRIAITKLLDQVLNFKESIVFINRIVHRQTLAEVGASIYVTKDRARQIESTLKKKLAHQKCMRYIEDKIKD